MRPTWRRPPWWSWRRQAPLLTAVIIIIVLALAGLAGESKNDADSGAPAASPTADATAPTPSEPGREVARVTRVIDGDTFEVSVGGRTERVRLIGVDTPETVDPRRPDGCFGKEASDFAARLLSDRYVELEKDVSERDSSRRLLRYVYLDGAMVNERLVREGYARAATFPPDVKYQQRFWEAEATAREAGRGLWGPACAATPPTWPATGAPRDFFCDGGDLREATA